MRYQPPSRRDDDETRCIAKERAGRLPRSLKYEAQRDALEISALLAGHDLLDPPDDSFDPPKTAMLST
jgi:hypothetical protein